MTLRPGACGRRSSTSVSLDCRALNAHGSPLRPGSDRAVRHAGRRPTPRPMQTGAVASPPSVLATSTPRHARRAWHTTLHAPPMAHVPPVSQSVPTTRDPATPVRHRIQTYRPQSARVAITRRVNLISPRTQTATNTIHARRERPASLHRLSSRRSPLPHTSLPVPCSPCPPGSSRTHRSVRGAACSPTGSAPAGS